jgi:hypothetical protein
LQSDSNKFTRRADRNKKMAAKGHGHSGKKNHHQQRKTDMDKELTEIRARMEELALWMQQDAKLHWVYEWPMKMKVKWPIKELLAQRQRKLLKE